MTGHIDMREAWNRISQDYQQTNKIPAAVVHYGPHCPNEDQLCLIGEVRGKRVLEIGCGGGQCAIAFAKGGAVATGIDLSDAQVEFARELASREGVEVTFLQGNIEDLSPIADATQDVVFSAYALGYVGDIARCFAEVARVLRPAGLFVFSWDHPFWDCLKVEEMRLRRSYHDRTPQDWDWEYQGGSVCARMRSYSRTVSDWFHLLRGAGLEVLDVLEPEPVESGSGQDDFGGDDFYAPARQRMVPATIIWKARKP